MQLEKAHASEAGLAGWISSNDVTLFTMVLVVVIALFLHANLIKGTSENQRLSSRNSELRNQNRQIQDELAATNQSLEAARRQRDALDAELRDRRQKLQETANDLQSALSQRDQLDSRLREAIARIANLDQSMQKLSSQKSQLESERAQLVTSRDSLSQDKTTLTERINALAAELEAKVKALQDAEQQRDRLRKQADNLDGIVAALQKKLNLANEDLAQLKTQSAGQMAQAETQIRDLEKKAQDQAAKAEDYLARLRRAAELFQGLQTEKKTLQSQFTNLEQQYQRQVARETTISRELVGLQGKLHRVAFLFDASGSMKERAMTGENRWLETRQITATWLTHLEVDECVLVVFASDVRVFPQNGSYLPVKGAAGAANREKLLELLNAVEPSGWTNTLDAFRVAYQHEGLDTIILFSDGAPTNSNSGVFDPRMVQQIYALCRQHPDIPVNSIGLGNYFDKDMGTFLRSVAQITGGTFRGR